MVMIKVVSQVLSPNNIRLPDTDTKWIKSYLLSFFGTFEMLILMFISILVFRPECQI